MKDKNNLPPESYAGAQGTSVQGASGAAALVQAQTEIPPSVPPKNDKGQMRARLKKALRFKQKRLAFPYAFLVAVFVIIPLLAMLVKAFQSGDGGFTLRNFEKFWGEGNATRNFWKSILTTFLLAMLTTLVSLLLAYPLALCLCRLKSNKRAILIMLFVAPMWINSLLRIYAVKLIFDDVFNRFSIDRWWLVLIGMVYDFFPFMLLPVYTSLAGMDSSFAEAAGDLGASPLKTLIKVKLPLSKQGIVSGIIMVFMPAMSSFAISGVLSNIELFGNSIDRQVVQGSLNIGSAYSLVLMMIVAVAFFVANHIARVKGEARTEGVL